MVESYSESPLDNNHPHHHGRNYHRGTTKQSLSSIQYSNSRGAVANHYHRHHHHHHAPARIPDGLQSSRVFDTTTGTTLNASIHPLHHRENDRKTITTEHSSLHPLNSSGRNTYRHTRNTDVSELFLAEAKAAQAKLDMEMDGNFSLDSFNSYAAIIDRPKLTRNDSSSTVDAVVPIDSNVDNQKELITLQVVDDEVQIDTTISYKSRKHQHRHHPRHQPQQQQQQQQHEVHRHYDADEKDENDNYDHQTYSNDSSHRHYRSYRKPLGLAYTLRKTDSGSTFQSLDGLSNVSPLIRHESKKKHTKRSSTGNKSKRKKRSTFSTTSSVSSSSSTATATATATATFTRTIHTSFQKCNPTSAFDNTNRFICFSAPTCLPIDHIKESFDDYRHRYYASTAYKNHYPTGTCSSSTNNNIMFGSCYDNHKYTYSHSSAKQREGPECSPSSSASPNGVNVQQQHQLHIQGRLEKDDDSPEISTTATTETIAPTKKIPKKNVRFTAPLVTKIHYRPYTPQSEIALLYFQEEELEELECDRETVMGDQFECQFDEMALAVHIAYKQINPTDE